MRVLLVNPPRFEGIPTIREERCEITDTHSVVPPYSLLQIASLLREDTQKVHLIDANGENLSYSELMERMREINYDILIFRFTPTTFDWDMKTVEISKQLNSNVKTVGICFTLNTLPTDVLNANRCLDIYVRHEYESVVTELVKSFEDLSKVNGIAYRSNDKIIINNDAEPIENYDILPLPAYDLLGSLDRYYINTPSGSPFTIMYTSKGCPYSCSYCTVSKTKLKVRSPENILSELIYLKKNFNIKTVSFFDETFTIDRNRVIGICEGIKNEKLDIVWYCNTRVDLLDKELLNTMYQSGCRGISYGIESGSQVILDNINKGIKIKEAMNAIKWAKNSGIKVYCSFIIGLPGENWDTVKETINFVKKTLPTSAQFNVAVPYPGTELFDYAIKKGFIKENPDWRNLYQHKSLMRTEDMTTDEITKARKMAYKSLYFNPRWWVQNLMYVVRHPRDFNMSLKYVLKIAGNYFIRNMEHSH